MRVVQMAGPALDRCNVGAYNCAYAPADDLVLPARDALHPDAGHRAGVLLSRRVRRRVAADQEGSGGCKPETIVIVDDSTEGWCDAYFRGSSGWWDGHDVPDDVTGSARRAPGSRPRAGGPRAGAVPGAVDVRPQPGQGPPGPVPEDTDAHRLACFTGKIVQVGGVRRAALISLSDLDSQACGRSSRASGGRRGRAGIDGKYLSMANNSAVYDFDGGVPVEVFMEEWLALVKSKSGERGIFNRRGRPEAQAGPAEVGQVRVQPVRRDHPPAAPVLQPVDRRRPPGRHGRDPGRKVRIAAIFGKVQSPATDFRYIRPSGRRTARRSGCWAWTSPATPTARCCGTAPRAGPSCSGTQGGGRGRRQAS
jgi:ribonucleoside-triphosphate reductase